MTHHATADTATAALDAVEAIMVRRAASAAYEAQRRPYEAHWDTLGPVEQDRWCHVARAVLRVAASDIIGAVREAGS